MRGVRFNGTLGSETVAEAGREYRPERVVKFSRRVTVVLCLLRLNVALYGGIGCGVRAQDAAAAGRHAGAAGQSETYFGRSLVLKPEVPIDAPMPPVAARNQVSRANKNFRCDPVEFDGQVTGNGAVRTGGVTTFVRCAPDGECSPARNRNIHVGIVTVIDQ